MDSIVNPLPIYPCKIISKFMIFITSRPKYADKASADKNVQLLWVPRNVLRSRTRTYPKLKDAISWFSSLSVVTFSSIKLTSRSFSSFFPTPSKMSCLKQREVIQRHFLQTPNHITIKLGDRWMYIRFIKNLSQYAYNEVNIFNLTWYRELLSWRRRSNPAGPAHICPWLL